MHPYLHIPNQLWVVYISLNLNNMAYTFNESHKVLINRGFCCCLFSSLIIGFKRGLIFPTKESAEKSFYCNCAKVSPFSNESKYDQVNEMAHTREMLFSAMQHI